MSNQDLNIQRCTIGEYNYFLEERVQEAQLSIGGLYVFMTKAIKGVEAAKCLSRINFKEGDEGLVAVKFALVDHELKPVIPLDGTMNDGLLTGDGDEYKFVNSSYFLESGITETDEDHNARRREIVHHRTSARSYIPVLINAPV